MSISDRMQNDGLSYEEARMKESLTMPNDPPAAGYPFYICYCGAPQGGVHADDCLRANGFTKQPSGCWSPPPRKPGETEALLNERGKTHGDFRDHADTTQRLKHVFTQGCQPTLHKLSVVQREAVDMILHKLGRIAAGDPNFADHWDDIAGYAKLVSQDLQRTPKFDFSTAPGPASEQLFACRDCGFTGKNKDLKVHGGLPHCPQCGREV